MTISVTIPWSLLVSDNRAHQSIRVRGQTIKRRSTEYHRQQALVRALCRAVVPVPLAGPVALYLAFHVPDNRRRDVQNTIKGLADGIVGGLVEDDGWQVVPRWSWEVVGIDRVNPRVEITVTQLEEDVEWPKQRSAPATRSGKSKRTRRSSTAGRTTRTTRSA